MDVMQQANWKMLQKTQLFYYLDSSSSGNNNKKRNESKKNSKKYRVSKQNGQLCIISFTMDEQ